MDSVRYSRSVRASLLTSAAGLCIALVPVAHADINDPTDPTTTDRPSYEDVVRTSQTDRPVYEDSQRIAQTDRPVTTSAQLDPQIVIANPNSPNLPAPDGSRDPVNINGIGQMIVDTQDGFIGLCTGTLINPRTVIFAAHCVNEIAASGYGQNSGGRPIAFGFQNSNNTPGNSAFGHYLATGNTNVADALYDVNYVAYNPRSTEPDAAGFLYADIAIASLDTPAKGIPTWAMLFSALPDPGTIGAAGTGYHVNLSGYGNNGTGTSGSTGGIDYRRRIAENMLGALASLDEFENFLFGGNATANPQNLYWIDFDDPRRDPNDGLNPSQFDFNAWRDNAVANGNEGITASGDSGGPLILDATYARQLVIGVLSGGYTRFFGQQPANGYGTAAFYQPLYLYWDWVAANNPYHYVSAVAGNGNWTDPTHWVSNVDPNYYIIGPNGQIVNNVPGSVGAGTAIQDGFGQACFQSGGTSQCLDIASGNITNANYPIGGPYAAPNGGVGGVTNDRAVVSNDLGSAVSQSLNANEAQLEAQANGNASALALPAATIDNGLPGATNFVPNNSDGNRLTSTKPRYFDVTLSASGTTTLSSAVTIDRFGLNGAGAVLDIASNGSLTSLMDINQITGTMQVNGLLTSPGDYFMMAGGLNGTGTITVPFFTSVAGTISPGASGAANNFGNLTFRGNIVLSSGTTYMVDLGSSGASDRIVVNSNGVGTGLANLGGRLSFNVNNIIFNNTTAYTYTILTSQGPISGKFIDPAPISAILTPKVAYTPNAVTVTIQVGLYGNFIPQSDTIGFAYAMLLDKNRSQSGNYAGLYGPLDLQNAATVRSNLNGLRPASETTVQSLALVGVDNAAGLTADRLAQLDPGSTGGTFARYGSPTQVAAVGLANRSVAGLSGLGFDADARNDDRAPVVEEGVLPEGTSAFVAGGYLKGDSAPMTGVVGRDNYDGWYVAGGIETWGDQSGIGFAGSYTSLDGTGAFVGNNDKASLYTGSLYGKVEMKNGVTLDAAVTAGLLDGSTSRSVTFVGTPYTLRSNSASLVVLIEVGLCVDFDLV